MAAPFLSDPERPVRETDFINESERSVDPADDAGKVVQLEEDGRFHPFFLGAAFETGLAPIIENTQTSVTETFSSSHTVTLPSGVVVGEVLLVLIKTSVGNTVTTPPPGWALVGNANNSLRCYAKLATGGDTFSITLNSTSYMAAISYRISNIWGSDNVLDIVSASPTDASASSETDPPALNAQNEFKEYLWLSCIGWNNTGNVSTQSDGYTNLDASSNVVNNSARQNLKVARKAARKIVEDPGVWTGFSGTTSSRNTMTVAVKRKELNVD